MLSYFSHVQLCATLWTVALQAPQLNGILEARILEWGAIVFSITLADTNCYTQVFIFLFVSQCTHG